MKINPLVLFAIGALVTACTKPNVQNRGDAGVKLRGQIKENLSAFSSLGMIEIGFVAAATRYGGIRRWLSPPAHPDLMLVGVDGAGGTLPPITLSDGGHQPRFLRFYSLKRYLLLVPSEALYNETGEACAIVAVQKSTGRIHCIPNVELAVTGYAGGSGNIVQENEAGDVLAFQGFNSAEWTGYNQIYRIKESSNELDVSKIFGESAAYAEEFAINAAGDVLIRYAPDSFRKMAVVKADGTRLEVMNSAPYTSCLASGTASRNQDFFYTDYIDSPQARGFFEMVKGATSGLFTSGVVRTEAYNGGSYYCVRVGYFGAAVYGVIQSQSQQWNTASTATGYYLEMISSAGALTMTPVNVAGTKAVIDIVGSASERFLLASDEFEATGFLYESTGTPTAILPYGQYEIAEAIYLGAQTALFRGTRTSDQKTVLATLSSTGTVTVLTSKIPTDLSLISLR